MKKTSAKRVVVDERGRITLPPELRAGAESFVIEKQKDGWIKIQFDDDKNGWISAQYAKKQ